MDLQKTITQLTEERDCLNEAIECLQRLASGRGRRRGRPPEWMRELDKKKRASGSGPKKSGGGGPEAVAS